MPLKLSSHSAPLVLAHFPMEVMPWLGLLVILAFGLLEPSAGDEECGISHASMVELQNVLSLATPVSAYKDLDLMREVYLEAKRGGREVHPEDFKGLRDYWEGRPEEGRRLEEGGPEEGRSLEERAATLLNKLLAAGVGGNPPTTIYDKVVVVGAGPVGLVHATQAALLGNTVEVFEKRGRHATRDVWFDVASPTVNKLSQNHDSLGFLVKLGMSEFLDLNETRHENVDGRGGSIWTLPLTGITRFLSIVLAILGVPITYDHQIDTIDPDPSILTCIADGASSQIAHSLGIPYVPPPSVVLEGIDFGYPSPHRNLIVTLSPTNATCPELRNGRDGKVIDPYFPGFVLNHLGVTSIFKRFFHDHCSMQIFFDSNGPRASHQDVVREALELLLVEPRGAAAVVTGMNAFSVLPRRLETVGARNFIFVGDASISAHYRLGIGINHGILMAEKYKGVLTGEMSASRYNELAYHDNAAAEMSMAKFIKLGETTMTSMHILMPSRLSTALLIAALPTAMPQNLSVTMFSSRTKFLKG